MFEKSSRYYTIEDAEITVTDPDGSPRVIRYKRRRIIPLPDPSGAVVEHAVTQGERLDNITTRYLDDPTQYWRVCDANEVMEPEMLEQIGRRIKIPVIGM
jgi:hypothetical protein